MRVFYPSLPKFFPVIMVLPPWFSIINWSRYRLLDAGVQERVECYSSARLFQWKELGFYKFYIKGALSRLRWRDLDPLKLQALDHAQEMQNEWSD